MQCSCRLRKYGRMNRHNEIQILICNHVTGAPAYA
jgi:hypothetical protein